METFDVVQRNCNLSNEKIYQIGSVLRSSLGRKSVESNLKDHMQAEGKKLEDFFKVEYLTFERTNENGEIYETEVPTVLCSDLNKFVTYIKNEREMTYATENRVGIDGGGGFVKICLNIVKKPKEAKEKTGQSPGTPVSIGPLSKYLNSGVKKLFILALVPCIPERYDNMKTLIQKLGLSNLDFHVASDLKLDNICAGISFMYIYIFFKSYDLKNSGHFFSKKK